MGNVTLYDGSYLIRQLSSEAQDKKDERLESQYEKKRNNWEDKYTEYMFGRNSTDKTVEIDGKSLRSPASGTLRASSMSTFKISDKDWDKENDELKNILATCPLPVESREKKEMPDSYWDY